MQKLGISIVGFIHLRNSDTEDELAIIAEGLTDDEFIYYEDILDHIVNIDLPQDMPDV